MADFEGCAYEDLSKDDQVRKNIIDQLQSEGIELLIPIVFDSSDESDEEPRRVVEQVEEEIDLHVRYANSLRAMKTVAIHTHSNRKLFENPAWYQSLLTQKTNAFSKDISYVDIASMSKEEFERTYLRDGGQPCILRGVLEEKNWRAKERWSSKEAIAAHYGAVPIKVTEIKPFHGMGRPNEIRIPISLYVEDQETSTADDPFYGFEHDMDPNESFNARVVFQEDYATPSLFENDFFDSSPKVREFYPNFRHLIIGGERTGTNLHVDPKATSAWNTLTCGYKKWALFPPGYESEYLALLQTQAYSKSPPSYWWQDVPSTLPDSIGMIECVQAPGETIFVPAGWWHCVLNIGFTVAITHNLLLLPTLPFQWRAFVAQYGCFTTHLAEKYPEVIAKAVEESKHCTKELVFNSDVKY